MGLFVDFVMSYNIKPLSLHRVFHGIRFKVNEDWESGKIPFFILVRPAWACAIGCKSRTSPDSGNR